MTNKRLLWIRLILLILLFLVISAGAVTALSLGLQRGKMSSTVQSFQGINKISVNAASLSVRIVEDSVTKVTVTDNTRVFGLVPGKKSAAYQTADTLYFNERNHFPFLFGSITGEITIEVPKGTPLEYQLNITSGSIYLDAPSKNTLKIKNTSGSVKVLQGADHLDLTCTSGSAHIDSAFETAKVKNTSGTILLSADEHSKELTCDNTSGTIKIRLDPSAGYDLSYFAVSGSFKDLYHDINYSKNGHNIYGDGSLKLDAKNISGSIKLCNWDS